MKTRIWFNPGKTMYHKYYNEEEMKLIEFMGKEKDKIFDFFLKNPIDKDSLMLKYSFEMTGKNDGKIKEGKLLYIFLALFIFLVSYDSRKTISCKNKILF